MAEQNPTFVPDTEWVQIPNGSWKKIKTKNTVPGEEMRGIERQRKDTKFSSR